MHATKSNLSIFQSRIAASTFTRPSTAAIIIEASTAFGVYLNSGVMSNSVNNKTMDITMFETAVLQPAMKFTAEREKDPT
uniref:Uncharacterized protein n=1 Tax=Cajanus cajan TaxID=3821 RepID=A0A151T0N0_CAJCA|nr:hypothetical protein KK1_022948 [Cajanus cajan]